jgi:hypothetical protein
MVKPSLVALLAAAVTLGSLSAPDPAAAKNNTGAIIGGLIAGAAIGAAVSSQIRQPKTVYVPTPPPPDPWPKTYSPAPGITCYPAQRACYNVNGSYNGRWTYNVYAR